MVIQSCLYILSAENGNITAMALQKIHTYMFTDQIVSLKSEMIGVLGHDPALVKLYWAGDNFG